MRETGKRALGMARCREWWLSFGEKAEQEKLGKWFRARFWREFVDFLK